MKSWVVGNHAARKFYQGGGVAIWNIYLHLYLKSPNLHLDSDFASWQIMWSPWAKTDKTYPIRLSWRFTVGASVQYCCLRLLGSFPVPLFLTCFSGSSFASLHPWASWTSMLAALCFRSQQRWQNHSFRFLWHPPDWSPLQITPCFCLVRTCISSWAGTPAVGSSCPWQATDGDILGNILVFLFFFSFFFFTLKVAKQH